MRPTFKAVILKSTQRKDGTYSVFIRIGFKSKYIYVPTSYSVSKTELKKNGEIKNTYIMDRCNELIAEYRRLIAFAGDLSNFDVKMVYDFIETRKRHQNGLDYSELFRTYLKENSKSPSIALYQATYNHLVRFKGDKIMVNDITPDFLLKFEGFLKETTVAKGKPMGSRGVNLYMSKVRAVYNWIMDEYIYKGYTFMYPFRKYKIPKAKYPKTVSLTKEQLRAIIETPLKGVEANRVRDAFVISLLTLGTNAKDLYELKSIGKRMDYNRSKTKGQRDDSAFISIKVEPELKPYLKKYQGEDKVFSFASTHVSSNRFNMSIQRGVKSLKRQINGIYGSDFIADLEFYDARRTVASIMRNKLGISTDDVGKCLNHKDTKNKTTDLYIEQDFSILDKCNRLFLNWLYE